MGDLPCFYDLLSNAKYLTSDTFDYCDCVVHEPQLVIALVWMKFKNGHTKYIYRAMCFILMSSWLQIIWFSHTKMSTWSGNTPVCIQKGKAGNIK